MFFSIKEDLKSVISNIFMDIDKTIMYVSELIFLIQQNERLSPHRTQ